jgi:GLPGLI family protein
MKKYFSRYLIPLLLIQPSSVLLAQKVLSEGMIQYDVSVQTGSSEAKMADVFDGASGLVYIKGNQSRSELKSALGSSITIYDSKAGTGVVIREFGSQKLLIRMNARNWADKNKKYEGMTFTKTGETKKIAGYNCEQATAKLADGSSFTVFYTTELAMENKNYDAQFTNLPGVPLEYESIMGNLRVKYSASKVSFDPVPVQRFEIPKSGYREMTYEESIKAVTTN